MFTPKERTISDNCNISLKKTVLHTILSSWLKTRLQDSACVDMCSCGSVDVRWPCGHLDPWTCDTVDGWSCSRVELWMGGEVNNWRHGSDGDF